MEEWITQVERLSLKRAPGMEPKQARDLAEELHRTWADSAPDEVVDKFFAFLSHDWNGVLRQH